MGMPMDYPPLPGQGGILWIMDEVEPVSPVFERGMLFCPKEERIMVTPDEYLSPVQLPDPASRTAAYTEITKVIHGIIFSHHAVPSPYQVAVHLAKRAKRPVTVPENPGVVEVEV